MNGDSASPRSLDEAVACLARVRGVRLVAGCTDVMLPGACHEAQAAPVMNLLRIPELRGITSDARAFRIGATTTFAQLRQHDEIRRSLPLLADAAGVVGGWQIQTRATVGGNIANASPAGDSLPVWLVLDAAVVVTGPEGPRTIPYSDVHVDYRRTALRPLEVIGWVDVPRPRGETRFLFRKVGARQALAIAKVVVAGAVTLVDGAIATVRLAAGSVAPIPIRLTQVEEFLSGRRPSADVAEEAGRLAAAGVHPVDDVRSSAAYRAHVLGRLFSRFVLNLAAPDTQ